MSKPRTKRGKGGDDRAAFVLRLPRDLVGRLDEQAARAGVSRNQRIEQIIRAEVDAVVGMRMVALPSMLHEVMARATPNDEDGPVEWIIRKAR